MNPIRLRAVCALLLGGLSAFAQETFEIRTFDPANQGGLLGTPPWHTEYSATWNRAAPGNRITYEGLILGDGSMADSAGGLTFYPRRSGTTQSASDKFDLRPYSTIEAVIAKLPTNQVNALTLTLEYKTPGGGTATLFRSASTSLLTRYGDRLVFYIGDKRKDLGTVTSIRLGCETTNPAKPARLIVRKLEAVNGTLFSPEYFPTARVNPTGGITLRRTPDYYEIVRGESNQNAPQDTGLIIGYDGAANERDLSGYDSFTIDAKWVSGPRTLRIEMTGADGTPGGGKTFWEITGTGIHRLRFSEGIPNGDKPANLARITGIYIYPMSPGPLMWRIGNISLSPSRLPTYTYRRGINISHWMSQLDIQSPPLVYGRDYFFTADDARKLKAWGFDHVRIPVEHDQWQTMGVPGYVLNDEKVTKFANAVKIAKDNGLGVILDLHSLPGLRLNQFHTLFSDENLKLDAVQVWRTIARRFANEGPWLRFELMNEPNAQPVVDINSAKALADLQERIRRAIRLISPNRVIYITVNDKGHRQQLYGAQLSQPGYRIFNPPQAAKTSLNPLYGWDDNIAYTLHLYEPMALTHLQGVFPSVESLRNILGPRYDLGDRANVFRNSQVLANNIYTIYDDLREPISWENKANHYLLQYREIHVGEFGIRQQARDYWANSQIATGIRHSYMKRMRDELERYGFAWCAWDYESGDWGVFDWSLAGELVPNDGGRGLLSPRP